MELVTDAAVGGIYFLHYCAGMVFSPLSECHVRDPQLGVKISSINFSDKAVENFNFLLPVAVLVFGSRMNDNFVNQGIQ